MAKNFPPDSIPLHKSFFLFLTTQISSSTTRSRIRFSLVVAFFCFLGLRFLIYPFFDFFCCFLPGFACKQGRGRQSHYKIGRAIGGVQATREKGSRRNERSWERQAKVTRVRTSGPDDFSVGLFCPCCSGPRPKQCSCVPHFCSLCGVRATCAQLTLVLPFST